MNYSKLQKKIQKIIYHFNIYNSKLKSEQIRF